MFAKDPDGGPRKVEAARRVVEGEHLRGFLERPSGNVCSDVSPSLEVCCTLVPSIPSCLPHCVYPTTSCRVNPHLCVFVLSHYKDSSNVRKKTLETGHHCSSSSSLPVIHDPPVFLLDPKLYPPQPQFLSPDVLMPSMAGEPYRSPGNTPKLILSAKM